MGFGERVYLRPMNAERTAESLVLLVEARTQGRGRRIRESVGLSQSDLAHALGVRQSTLWRWENGQRQPTGALAIRYARLLRALEQAGALEQAVA